jgi:hypothetical protein
MRRQLRLAWLNPTKSTLVNVRAKYEKNKRTAVGNKASKVSEASLIVSSCCGYKTEVEAS